MADSFEPRFEDLVRNYTTTVGTGNFVPGNAVNGYRSFGSAIAPGESFYYSAIGVEKPAEFEVGRGTMQADGTISRQPVSGSLTAFTEGSKSIALVAASEWYETIQAQAHESLAAVATRAELAARDSAAGPALLLEPGAEGLFYFDGSDQSAAVAADPAEGVYVTTESDPTGASGAWVRSHTGTVDPRWFGAVGDGVADDTTAIQAALDHLQARQGGVLRLGHSTYLTTQTLAVWGDDITVDARGATVTSGAAQSNPILWVGGDRASIHGGTWLATSSVARQFDVNGRDCHIDACVIKHEPDFDTVQMYIRYGADGFRFTNCRVSGANEALFVEASNVLISGNTFLATEAIGGDDCVGIKAIQGITENIRIIGNYIRRHAAMVSIGSSIGVVGVDDPAYSRRVRNISVVGNVGERCAYGLYIKPGAIAADYRNGVVENLTFSDNVLHDPDGNLFERGIAITAARGAIVRNIHGDNNLIVARACGTSATGVKAGMHIYFTGTGSIPTFENIDVEMTFRDPHGGVAGGGTAPGYPVSSIAIVQPNGATVRGINLRLEGSGCSGAGIHVYAGIDDAVTVSRAKLDAINAGGTGNGGITTNSRIRVGNDVSIGMVSGNPYRLVNGTTAEIVGNADTVFLAETIAAGTDQTRRPWAAPRNAFVHRIDLLSAVAINQSADDVNYTQFEFRNMGGNTYTFHSVGSKLTGGRTFPADTFNTLMLARDVTNGTHQTQCFFVRDSHLSFRKDDFGSGNAVSMSYMRVHWAPY